MYHYRSASEESDEEAESRGCSSSAEGESQDEDEDEMLLRLARMRAPSARDNVRNCAEPAKKSLPKLSEVIAEEGWEAVKKRSQKEASSKDEHTFRREANVQEPTGWEWYDSEEDEAFEYGMPEARGDIGAGKKTRQHLQAAKINFNKAKRAAQRNA